MKADAKLEEKEHKEAAKDHGGNFLGEAKAAVGHAKDAAGDKLHSKKHEGYAAVRARMCTACCSGLGPWRCTPPLQRLM